MVNLRKYRNIKIVITEKRNYKLLQIKKTTKFSTENLLVIEMRKTLLLLNKPFYVLLSISDLITTVMYDYWYEYVKLKYVEKAKLCYMDVESFIVHVNR